jgi:hypothetical protein
MLANPLFQNNEQTMVLEKERVKEIHDKMQC